MKPYGWGYSSARYLALPLEMAWGSPELGRDVPSCSTASENGQLEWTGNSFLRSSSNPLSLPAVTTLLSGVRGGWNRHPQAVIALLNIPQAWLLSVDRSEWQFGKCIFKVLVLGVVHQGVAIPLVWTRLDKRGHSHTLERMQWFRPFLEDFAHVKVS